MVRKKKKIMEYGIELKRVMRGRIVIGKDEGWMKEDGEIIYKEKDMRVGM